MRRNLTLAIDGEILTRARIEAASRRTTVNALVRDYLASLAGNETARKASARWLSRMMHSRPLGVGKVNWTRDELHER